MSSLCLLPYCTCIFVIMMTCIHITMETSNHYDSPPSTVKGCDSMECGPGHECISERGVAYCTCVRQCPIHFKLVCGSDGMIYPNFCHMHRRACERKEVIRRKPWSFCNVTKLPAEFNSNAKLYANSYSYSDSGSTPNSSQDTNEHVNTKDEDKKSIMSTLNTSNGRFHGDHKHISDAVELKSIAPANGNVVVSPINGETTKNASGSAAQSPTIRSIEVTIENAKSGIYKNNRKPMRNDVAPVNDGSYVASRNAAAKDGLDDDDIGGDVEEYDNRMNHIPICSFQQHNAFKDLLLGFMRRQLQPSSDHVSEDTREQTITNMFSRFDLNGDGLLRLDELKKVNELFSLAAFGADCDVTSLIHFDDTSRDSQIDINEFFVAFSRSYDISVVSLDKRLELSQLSANVGDNAEIRCDISGSPLPNIVWKRSGVLVRDVKSKHLQVFSDGSLYISDINQNLAGNYTCQAESNSEIRQTHVLHVNSVPTIWVDRTEIYTDEKSEITIRCDASGVPRPQLFWLKNGEAIGSRPSVYTVSGDGGLICLHAGAENSLIGTYTCQAKNAAGHTNANVLVKKALDTEDDHAAEVGSHSRLAVLHRDGISVYDGEHCRLISELIGTERLTETERVCQAAGQTCIWGDAVRIGDNRLYVTQPDMSRILLIDTVNSSVVERINTDQFPVKLHYLQQHDQMWVLNWRDRENSMFKLVQVIREASNFNIDHHTIHLQPISRHIDLVADMLLPSSPQEDSGLFEYGYVTHANHRGMYKVDLSTLNFVKSTDFTQYNCVPAHTQFSTIFGYVIIGCMEPVTSSPNGQLLYDQLTDSVIAFSGDVIGRPLLTSDSLICVTYHVSTVNLATGAVNDVNETLITVQKVTRNGLELMYRLRTPLLISDVTFSKHSQSRGYQMVASTFDLTQLMLLDISTGKVDILPLSSMESASTTQKHNRKRPISSPGGFHNLLAVTDESTLFLVDIRKRSVTCQIAGFANVTGSIWLTNKLM